MGRRNKDDYNKYMREYVLARYHEKRDAAVQKLGGKCVKCGSVENLEIDHIDPKLKTGAVGKLWTYAEKRFDEEIEKCQLLCETCHKAKTLVDKGLKPGIGNHGTLASYRYCRCDLCKEAKRNYQKEYNLRKNGS